MHLPVLTPLFYLPALVLVLVLLGLFHVPYAMMAAVIVGVIKIVIDSYSNIRKGRWSLDYVAFLAMVVSLFSGEYLAGAVIALMFTGGEALEAFASERAHTSLKALSESIPKVCQVKTGTEYAAIPIQKVKTDEVILVKRGELVPLDGVLVSVQPAVLNVANLTGEAEPVSLKKGTLIKSGSVNEGEAFELKVHGDFSSSTYHKIVALVEEAKAHPARTVRISEKANYYFTVLTLFIAGFVYVSTHDMSRLLSVLVIATPCPLIIAAPVAFVSGMSRVARSGIILRKPAAFEDIHSASTIFFDKTGTLTLGEPVLEGIEILHASDQIKTEKQALGIAAGIEMHSLHPLAKAVVTAAKQRDVPVVLAENVTETIGKGISGEFEGKRYHLSGVQHNRAGIILMLADQRKTIAHFHFADVLKRGALRFLESLQHKGLEIAVITGDKQANADLIFQHSPIKVYAEQSPEDKHRLIKSAKRKHERVVMVGDGLNDAPALAMADVGVVFSGSENGASIEAADVAVLGSDIHKLTELFEASHRTMQIAKQSIYGGILISTVGMLLAGAGFIRPVAGAFIQECIDVIVILNALRALKK